MKDTLKNFLLNHSEKVVLLLVLAWGVFHSIRVFSPSDYDEKSQSLDRMMETIRINREKSVPETLTSEDFYSKMAAPFVRVPRVKIQDTWRVYRIPKVESDHHLVVGGEKTIPLRLVQDAQPAINILEGKEFVQVEPSGTPGELRVKGLGAGIAKVEYVATNSLKEVHTFVVSDEEGKTPQRGEAPQPPAEVTTTVERGRIVITIKPTTRMPKKSKITGHQVFRKESGGEFAPIHLIPFDENARKRKVNAFAAGQPPGIRAGAAAGTGNVPAAGTGAAAAAPGPGAAGTTTPGAASGGTGQPGGMPAGGMPAGGMPAGGMAVAHRECPAVAHRECPAVAHRECPAVAHRECPAMAHQAPECPASIRPRASLATRRESPLAPLPLPQRSSLRREAASSAGRKRERQRPWKRASRKSTLSSGLILRSSPIRSMFTRSRPWPRTRPLEKSWKAR
ncbi:MAG: hypothetical protein HYU36_12970 [Planctomycetes bacterium]|nr:hypothetical protein [Planctomycetota bacterium]